MKGVPAFTVTADSAMPATALHSGAGEPFIVPSDGANVAGGKELLRIMLSKDAATNFTKTKLAPTIVKGLVPADGFGSTALVSQTDMLDAAGDDIFNFNYCRRLRHEPGRAAALELVPQPVTCRWRT